MSGSEKFVGGENLRTLSLDRLRVDQKLRFPIHGQDGVLLLSAESVVTERVLEALRQRGIDTIVVHREETAVSIPIESRGRFTEVRPPWPGTRVAVDTNGTMRLDRSLGDEIQRALEAHEPPFMLDIPNLGTQPYEESLTRELYHTHEQCVGKLRSLQYSIIAKQSEGHRGIHRLVDEYLQIMVRDLDLFSSFATAPHAGHYPNRHSLHVAMLSLAMGVRAGLGSESMYSLGLGAILHDIGMLRVPRSIWSQKTPLSVSQRLDIMMHPIYSLDALEGITEIGDDVRCIVYQVHERAMGQGYPRQVPSELIHPLAKIVAVADVYVAMVSDRPYRPALLPYKAMEGVIKLVQSGWFDPETARLLLETLSLYPVGSYVRLNDRRLGKVVRSNGSTYDRPILRVWPERTPPSEETGEMLDMCEHAELKVVEALPAPP
ncbi:MAG: HD domain-containing phosphohydrolase [Planctomycetota bacterium]